MNNKELDQLSKYLLEKTSELAKVYFNKPLPANESVELFRIDSRLDALAIPTKNNGVKMSTISHLNWLINHYNINVDDLSHYERLQRLNSDISNDLVGGE